MFVLKKQFFKTSVILSVGFCIVLTAAQINVDGVVTNASKLSDVLIQFGDEVPLHKINFTGDQVKKGKEIVLYGRTQNTKGKLTSYVSKHYVCTSCHNIEIEDPDLRFSNPETRLPYIKSKGIPFLQGTTFKGIVNRESWYNDDYVKKYGDKKIRKAHKSLKESTQLCAVECSQGRPMKDWELEAVLAYFWSLEFDLKDLEISSQDYIRLNDSRITNSQKIELLKSYYLQGSPAHFYDSPEDKNIGYPGLIGDANRGKDIYELSCLHCHKVGGVSHYILDNQKLSFKDLEHYINKNSHFSLYQIIPYGTYAIPGHKPYMPHYPLERMSMQQVEDLRAYIEQKAS